MWLLVRWTDVLGFQFRFNCYSSTSVLTVTVTHLTLKEYES